MDVSDVAKPKLALYWAAACGGCEIAVLDIGAKILDVAEAFELVFWPVALDFKVKDVEAMPDGSITLCLLNGAIRTDENERMAKLLRAKSVVLVAFGSCAYEGCIPALSNTTTASKTLQWSFHDAPSVENADRTTPQLRSQVPEGELELPGFWNTVKALDQVVDVDYYVPGCPPQADRIWDVLEAVIAALETGAELPPKGSVLGAGTKTLCDECPRERDEKHVTKFVRPHEILADPELCLLDQGVVCAGPATRSGCGAKCVSVNLPCRGCYGPPPGVRDQGAKLLSALASVIDSEHPDELDGIIDGLVDPIGTLYRFSLAHSTLHRVQNGNEQTAERAVGQTT